MIAYIESVGLQAPGLEGWRASQPILQGQKPYQAEKLTPYSPGFLPANERRRTTDTIKLALRTAENTVENYSQDAISNLPTLFACVDGDTQISAKMTTAILQDEPMISPIHFHNSVHNAPAGYWMIGQKNHTAASSISAGHYQIGSSLLEAITTLTEQNPKIMVVWYDLPVDPILEIFQPDIAPFGCGFILTKNPDENTLAKVEFTLESAEIEGSHKQESESEQTKAWQDEWFGNNRAATCLPLLKSLAQKKHDTFYFPMSEKLKAHIALQPL